MNDKRTISAGIAQSIDTVKPVQDPTHAQGQPILQGQPLQQEVQSTDHPLPDDQSLVTQVVGANVHLPTELLGRGPTAEPNRGTGDGQATRVLPQGDPHATLPQGIDSHAIAGSEFEASTTREPRYELPTIAGYEILCEVARGGMGVVYKARQLSLNRIVALKMALASQHASLEDKQRFRLEAKAVGQLDHPGIVPIYDVGEHAGQLYFTMSFVDGQTLRELLNQGPMPAKQAAAMIQSVAAAVHYAHTQGIIHRDIKPANIMVDRHGQLRVTDFGLAKVGAIDSQLTGSGQILGTPSYMPPEQAQSKSQEIGPRADVYSLGATLYCLLTGRPPFQAANLVDILMQVTTQEPVAPRALDGTLPRDIETICLKCLEKSPTRRYESAQELADDLERFIGNQPVRARPLGAMTRGMRWCSRNPIATSLIAMTGLLMLVMSIGLWYRAQYATAQSRLATTQALAELNAYFTHLNRARVAIAGALPGATYFAHDELKKAIALQPASQSHEELRNVLVELLSRPDLQRVATLETGIRAGALQFSPDGTRLAVGQFKDSTSFAVQIYSTATLSRVASYRYSTLSTSVRKAFFEFDSRYQDGARALTWSPDGKWLAVGTRFGTIAVWDTTQNSSNYQEWLADPDRIDHLQFTSDGKILQAFGKECSQWSTDRNWSEVTRQRNPWGSYAMSPDGQIILGQDAESKQIRVHSVSDYQVLSQWPTTIDMRIFAISSDNRLVLGVQQGKVFVRFLEDGRLYQSWEYSEQDDVSMKQLQFMPDGRTVLARDSARYLRFWDVDTAKRIMAPISSAQDDFQVACSSDGRWLAYDDYESASAIQLATWRDADFHFTIGQPGWVRALDMAPDGQQIAIASSVETNGVTRQTLLERWMLQAQMPVESIRCDHPAHFSLETPFSIAWHPSGGRVAWFAGTSGLIVSSTDPPESHRLLPAPDFQRPIELAATRDQQNTIRAWLKIENTEVGLRSDKLALITRAAHSVWSPDGSRLWALTGEGKRLTAWDAESLQLLSTWTNEWNRVTTGQPNINSLSVSGQSVLLGGENGHLMVPSADPTEGQITFLRRGPGGAINALELVSDFTEPPTTQPPTSVDKTKSAQLLLLGTQTGRVQIRRWPEDQLVCELPHNFGSIQTVAASPVNALIATGGSDGMIRVYRIRSDDSYLPWLTLNGRCGMVTKLTFTRDGKFLAAAGRYAKFVSVWSIEQLQAAVGEIED